MGSKTGIRGVAEVVRIGVVTPVNKETREGKIRGARTWEDLEDQEGRMEGGSLLRKGDLIERMGIRTGGLP